MDWVMPSLTSLRNWLVNGVSQFAFMYVDDHIIIIRSITW